MCRFCCKPQFLFLWEKNPEFNFSGVWQCLYTFLKNSRTVFLNCYTILDSHWQCMIDPISLHSCLCLVLLLFFVFNFGHYPKYLVIYHCHFSLYFLMTNGVEHPGLHLQYVNLMSVSLSELLWYYFDLLGLTGAVVAPTVL